MGAAKGRNEVVQSFFVGQVDSREPHAPLVLVPVKNIVLTEREVEEIAGGDAGGVVIVVLSAGRGDRSHTWKRNHPPGKPGQIELIATVGVASTPPQESPAWNC